MIEGWLLWLILVVLAIGVVVAGVALVRLPRGEDDVSASERRSEAGWIADTIEHHGGVAPPSLVEEVLDLHQAYLRAARIGSSEPWSPPPPGQRPPRPPGQVSPPAPPGYATPPPPPGHAAPPSPPGYAPPPPPSSGGQPRTR